MSGEKSLSRAVSATMRSEPLELHFSRVLLSILTAYPVLCVEVDIRSALIDQIRQAPAVSVPHRIHQLVLRHKDAAPIGLDCPPHNGKAAGPPRSTRTAKSAFGARVRRKDPDPRPRLIEPCRTNNASQLRLLATTPQDRSERRLHFLLADGSTECSAGVRGRLSVDRSGGTRGARPGFR